MVGIIIIFIVFIVLIFIVDETSKSKKEHEAKERKNAWIIEKVGSIRNDYLDMKEDKRFQKMMDDVKYIINQKQKELEFITIEYYYPELRMTMINKNDKWSAIPQETITIDLRKYQLVQLFHLLLIHLLRSHLLVPWKHLLF